MRAVAPGRPPGIIEPATRARQRRTGCERSMAAMPASDQHDTTFPRLLAKHATERGERPATREKDLGIWQTWTWSQVAADVRALACGLAAQGFQRGMHLAIIGDNRPRLYWSMTAAQALGGVPVPMYQDAPAAEFVYVLNDAEIAYAVDGGCSFDNLRPDDSILSYLPMAWVGDHLFSYAQWLVAGFTINCPESGDTVMIDLREIGPTYYFAPPRVFENLLTQVMIRMEDASAVKRWLFGYFTAVARRCGAEILDGRPVPFADRLRYAIGNILVYGPLRNVLGMSRIRIAYTAGAAIGPDLFRFHRSIGINLKQLYGSTETCAYVCLQPDGGVKFDTVGKAAPGVEIKIADNGEVLVRGAMLLKEYYKHPHATAESIDAEGYFHTGDAGFIDADGQLKIIDRAKDVGKLATGAMFAPNYIENKLKFFPHIKEAVAFGNNRDKVCAFINIDIGSVGNWAERRGIPYSGYTDLAAKPEVYELVRECVEKVNAELANEGSLSDSQVRRFLILHKELDPDDDELTRTRKVRRGFVAEKYAVLIDALYSGKPSQYIETQVKFEDGRTGNVKADLRIIDVAPQPPLAKAA